MENVENENGSMEENATDIQNDNKEDTQKSFTQEDVNKIISKRLDRERSKWEKEFEDKLEEAQKVAKMSTEEKYQHELNKKEKELSIKEKEINEKELKITAYEILKERELPSELMGLLNYSNIDELKKSVDIAEKALKSAMGKPIKFSGIKPVDVDTSTKTSSDPFLQGLKIK
ncbi:LPS O-antigen subunit length determinant protein (WzzB/FepE family) [Clostridium tetanomorphum]|uniref:DUF4355 domain-containing protein n=1 Tax=Clostridium tetanomorphum TaxID=1553 RepID=UPI0004474BAC|nr:DUF4355 domain-containing protein [Clostridium tetanomorphum]KAJ49098.1 phage scaffold protein [Clostridium tetanomorphum DSM 665]KAJ49712.1 phage scaffold protein [Clostridium tetanomorphum DSM 665]MBP1866584.1 LPS O-antigen subunit length determinant protein (WzzB/FepE family) [Clostridium tetanomorphum]NRS86636.1 LPS O-antigen subunit length determinant protein (WzzB/FepE family) [Clostridium tetanomorphum]SQC01752.1 Uncharacterised protein [Clostridium tetanomorphum]